MRTIVIRKLPRRILILAILSLSTAAVALIIWNPSNWFNSNRPAQSTVPGDRPQTDSLGEVGPNFFPKEVPSYDATPQRLEINGQTYLIPRNYIFSAERINQQTLGNLSMRALLPKLSGIIQSTADCFLRFNAPCSSDVVTIGITKGEAPNSSRSLQNLRDFIDPEKKTGACGFEYYADRAPTDQTGQGFNYFLQNLSVTSNPSLLRCPKDRATNTSSCNSTENIGDGNSVYFVFHRSKLCQWPQIQRKILELIVTFKTGG